MKIETKRFLSSMKGNIDPSRNVFIIPRTTDYIIPNNQAKIDLEILNYMNPNSQLHELLSHCENSLVQSAFDVLDYTATDDIRFGISAERIVNMISCPGCS